MSCRIPRQSTKDPRGLLQQTGCLINSIEALKGVADHTLNNEHYTRVNQKRRKHEISVGL